MILDNVLIFKIESDRLKGTIREFEIHKSGEEGEPRIIRDEFVPLPDLTVEGKTSIWKAKMYRRLSNLRKISSSNCTMTIERFSKEIFRRLDNLRYIGHHTFSEEHTR